MTSNPLKDRLAHLWRRLGAPSELRKRATVSLDAAWYVERHGIKLAKGQSALEQFLASGLREGLSPTPLFDAEWYLAEYTDVAARGIPAFLHFLKHGMDEGRDPHPLFSNDYYRERYPDVASGNMVPFLHFIKHGLREGRSPNPFFDVEWYQATYPDIQAAGVKPWYHFICRGAAELRSPGPSFDAAWYASKHPEVAEQGVDPLTHYMTTGRKLGLPTKSIESVEPVEPGAVPTQRTIPSNLTINIPLTDKFFNVMTKFAVEDCEVSIIILSYKRPDFVENLIKSIWLFSQGYKYEIIVVDNGSPLGEHRIARQFSERIRTITLEYNHYIGDGYNIGVEEARGNFVIIMNNDIVVQPNWLPPLIDTLKADETIGAVGPKFLYPTGELQEAGALIHASGVSIQLGKRGHAAAAEFNRPREVDYCTGATIAFRRAEYIELLGLDWRWQPGYYEDVDLCFKFRERGKRILYQPESVVFHLESATMSTAPPSAGMSLAAEDNRKAFVAKWGQWLLNDCSANASPSALKFDNRNMSWFEQIVSAPNSAKKQVGIFIPYEFIPGGGEKYAISIAESFGSFVETTLIFPSRESVIRVMSVLRALDFDLLDLRVTTVDEAQVNKRKFDLFIMIGNELFPKMAGIGDKNLFVCQFPFPVPHDYLVPLHVAGYYKTYDKYIVYSDYVKMRVEDKLHAWDIDKPVVMLPPTATFIGSESGARSMDILAVGRFFIGGHNKRHDVMIEAMRLMTTRYEDVNFRLNLAGAVHKELVHRTHLSELQESAKALPIDFHLNIDRVDLEHLYRRSAIYWHAAGWGVDVQQHPERVEHFGTTIVEAMSAGCIPVVYAVGGPVEIVKHGVNGITVTNEGELADWTMRLIRDYDKPWVRQMREAAIETAHSYAKPSFRSRVLAVVGEL